MSCNKVNSGVHCEVANCHFHDKEDHCTASKINVGPGYAFSSADTICATFKPNK